MSSKRTATDMAPLAALPVIFLPVAPCGMTLFRLLIAVTTGPWLPVGSAPLKNCPFSSRIGSPSPLVAS